MSFKVPGADASDPGLRDSLTYMHVGRIPDREDEDKDHLSFIG